MPIIRKMINKIKGRPVHDIMHRAGRKLRREMRQLYQYSWDLLGGTYSNTPLTSAELKRVLVPVPQEKLRLFSRELRWLAEQYLQHRFDLLGSGWVRVEYGMNCAGLEGHKYKMGSTLKADSDGAWLNSRINKSNLSRAREIWRLISKEYTPIDWQLDFKSGYRWDEKTGYYYISYGQVPGVDIKVPWELARMQHLPHFAFAYALAKGGETDYLRADYYLEEYQNQILDFIATNPPRFGVNWKTAMDVAIRAVNWLIAYDLFSVYGAEFSESFKRVFKLSLQDHYLHIQNNLEWHEEYRGNHYLANVTGLLFLAVYGNSSEADEVLIFAIQELIAEMNNQFYEEGSNFEGSTSYHRLSGEMMMYCTALVLGLDQSKLMQLSEQCCSSRLAHKVRRTAAKFKLHQVQELKTPFSEDYFARLERIAQFTINITKPDGSIPQIGDNDSGRLLKITPIYDILTVSEAKRKYANLHNYNHLPDGGNYLDENFLKHTHLVVGINSLVQNIDFKNYYGEEYLEYDLVKALSNNNCLHGKADEQKNDNPSGSYSICQEFSSLAERNPDRVRTYRYKTSTPGFRLVQYPQFGLYIWKAQSSYLAVRCKEGYSNPYIGHMHNDQLALEVVIDGKVIFSDPGTYLYTSLPAQRNRYRSVNAHFGPVKGIEPTDLSENVFSFMDQTSCQCLYCGNNRFIGRQFSPDMDVWRSISIENGIIEIIDLYLGVYDLQLLERRDPLPYSAGYGKRAAYYECNKFPE